MPSNRDEVHWYRPTLTNIKKWACFSDHGICVSLDARGRHRTFYTMAVVKQDDHEITWDSAAMERGLPAHTRRIHEPA
jgi:hypothetical protein